jgi:hypothetical protein
MEDDVGHIADAELQAIVPLQRLALHPFAVDERSVLAVLVRQAELPVFRGDLSMVAGDARIGHYQVLTNFASYGIRRCSFPCTNTRMGNTPEPGEEAEPVMGGRAMALVAAP